MSLIKMCMIPSHSLQCPCHYHSVMIITYFTKGIFLCLTIISTTLGAVASDVGQEVSELSVEGLVTLFGMRAMNLLEYAYTQNGAGKRFLADLFDAATVNEDWFSAISSTNDPRTEWCGYPTCEDNQLHGREHQNWQQLVPVNTNDCDTGWLSCYLNFFTLSTAYIICEPQDLPPWCMTQYVLKDLVDIIDKRPTETKVAV